MPREASGAGSSASHTLVHSRAFNRLANLPAAEGVCCSVREMSAMAALEPQDSRATRRSSRNEASAAERESSASARGASKGEANTPSLEGNGVKNEEGGKSGKSKKRRKVNHGTSVAPVPCFSVSVADLGGAYMYSVFVLSKIGKVELVSEDEGLFVNHRTFERKPCVCLDSSSYES